MLQVSRKPPMSAQTASISSQLTSSIATDRVRLCPETRCNREGGVPALVRALDSSLSLSSPTGNLGKSPPSVHALSPGPTSSVTTRPVGPAPSRCPTGRLSGVL